MFAGLFGAAFSAVGLYVCAGAWRGRLIRCQLMGTIGISEATGTVTSKDVSVSTHRNHDGNQRQMTTYHISYNFTATINGQESQVYVDGTRVDSVVYNRFTPPCAATVRFLEREPRRCALKHAAEMETNHWCHNLVLACFTCIPSIFILAGAGVGLGIPLNMGVDGAAKAAGAGTYAIIIGVTLVFVYRALWMKVHAVICCLSGVKYCTEFNNVNVTVPAELGADGASALA